MVKTILINGNFPKNLIGGNVNFKEVFSSHNLAKTALLIAIVIVLQYFGSYVQIGTIRFSFVLVPIVLGSIIVGPINGGIIGLGFGIITIIMGLTGYDQFTGFLLQESSIATVLVCVVKSVAAGYFPGLFYRLLSNKNNKAAIYVSAISAPILNTSLFIAGMLLMQKTLYRLEAVQSTNIFYFLFIQAAGVNFIVELAINLLLVPVLSSVIKVLSKEK